MDSSSAAVGSALHILLLDPRFRLSDTPWHTRSADLARRLVRAGHRVSVVTTDADLDTTQVEGLSLDVIDAPDDAARIGGRFARALWFNIWRRRDVDAVIAADCPASALPAVVLFCFLRGIPFILDERAIPAEPVRTAPWFDHLFASCGRITRALASRASCRVFVSSDEVEDALIARGIVSARVAISPTGCEPAAWSGHDAPPAPWTSTAALIYAGPLERDLEPLIHLAGVLRARDDHRLGFVLCGDGPARAHLEALAAAQGVRDRNLWFVPAAPRRDLPGIIAGASAVIARTRFTSADAGLPFYDALAAGKPVLLLDNGPLAELVVGRAAGIVLPTDPIAAAREVGEFLGDSDGLRRASAQAGALGAGRFMVDRIAGDVRQCLEQRVAAEPRATVMRRRMLAAKRLIDIVGSATALIALLPLLVVIAVAIMLKMNWPPLFTQERPGLNGRLFRIIKFRTMTDARDAEGTLLPDEQRLTPLGKFLRRTSLDELPELINVFAGDMSLVGPRPLLPEYLAHYTAEQRRRHELRPGMTGWSQINGRNALSWEDRFALDVWYVDNLSLWLDIKIMVKTAWIALLGRGVNAPGHATMPRFDEIVARREGAEDV